MEIFHRGKLIKTIKADGTGERFSLGEFPVGGYWVKTDVGSTAFDVEQMNRYHITSIQFYDWMYRHHQLIPNTDVFKDALDRSNWTLCMLSILRERRYGLSCQSLRFGISC